MAREEKVGNPYKELVLRTSGTIKVLVGDKYYTLNYNNKEEETKDESTDEQKVSGQLIVATNGIEEYLNGSLEYPGDNVIIFVPGDQIYYTINGEYSPFLSSQSQASTQSNFTQTTFNDTVIFNNITPFIINNSTGVIKNLNAQYLNGYLASDFLKKSDTMVFKSIKTSDELCTIDKGILTIPTIKATTINANTLAVDNITSSLSIGNTVIINGITDYKEGKYINNTTNLLSEIYNLFINNEINSELSFIDLSKSLLTIVNSTYNWEYIEDAYLPQLLNSGILFKVTNIDLWKSITLKDSEESLYDSILKYGIYEDIEESFNGALFSADITSGDLNLNDIIYFNLGEASTAKTIDFEYKGIITYKKGNYIEFKSNFQTESWINSEVIDKIVNIIDNLGNSVLSFTVQDQSYPDVKEYEVLTLNINNGIIGDLNNISDPVFGQLSGYGVYSNGNCILINPSIAIKNNIRLSEDNSYIGNINNEKWISISDNKCIIQTPGYTIDSDGYIKTNAFTINPDGTLTVGNITGTLQVAEDGTIKLI